MSEIICIPRQAVEELVTESRDGGLDLMDRTGGFFVDLFIPPEIAGLDHPSLMEERYDEVAPIWAQVLSEQKQVERAILDGVPTHHSVIDAILKPLVGAAKILAGKPDDARRETFYKAVRFTPEQYLSLNGF